MKELEFNVKGMICNGCENRIKNSLSKIDGVERVEANFQTGIIKVDLSKNIDEKVIKETIEDIGYEFE